MRLRLAVLFVLCAGCDESAPESTSPPATNEATTNEATTNEATTNEATTNEATAQAAAPAANSCAMTIRVSGDHTFEDEVSFRVARVERNDGAWLSLMATEVTNQPGYILNMFLRADASGGVPLDEPGMNKLNITMVPGEDYSAHDMGGEAAGSVTVTQGPEGWLSAEGTGHLSDGNGGELHVIVHVTTAIPPMQCPRD